MIDQFGADAFRYFLLREVPFGQDGDFSEQALARRVNSDLANGIGNLLSRTLTMIERNCSGSIPTVPTDYLDSEAARAKYPLLVHVKESLRTLEDCLDESYESLAFNNLLVHATNILTGHEAKLSKPQGAKPVSETPASPQPAPVTPSPAAAPSPAPATAAPAAAQPAQIGIDDFMKIQLKAAKVLSAERVPKSEKLLKLQVSLGSEQRQIVAGIGKKYEPETLIGKTIVIVANLKPAKLMGIESQGMVLAAGDSEVRGLATFIEDVEPGTKVK